MANLHLPALGAALNVPTQEQADHTSVKVKGPFNGGHYRFCVTVQSSPSSLRNKQITQVSSNTAQIEPLYRSGQQEVHQHYGPEERGLAARLCDLAFGVYFPAE